MLGVSLYLSWQYTVANRLVREELPSVCSMRSSVTILGDEKYALGAISCVRSRYWSLAFIVLVQRNHAIAPRLLRSRSQRDHDFPPDPKEQALKVRTWWPRSHGRAIPA